MKNLTRRFLDFGFVATIVSLSTAPTVATSLGTFISDPKPVNTTATSDHQGPYPVNDYWPDIATDDVGTWLVVWTQASDDPAEDDRIVLSRSTDFGQTWAPPATLFSALDSGFFPEIATDGEGAWGVAWQRQDQRVVFARSTDNGATWSSPVQLDPAPTTQRFPTVAVDTVGNWIATWEVNSEVIVVARSTDDGVSWGPPGQLGNSLPGTSKEPRVAMAANGGMVAVWECMACEGQSDRDIRFSRGFLGECSVTVKNCAVDGDCPEGESCVMSGAVDCSSVPPGTPCCPGTIDGDFCFVPSEWLDSLALSDTDVDLHPDVATDGRGNWIATWWTDLAPPFFTGVASIVVARSADDGRTWSSPAAILTRNVGSHAILPNPVITTDGLGNWVVVWDSTVDASGNISTDADLYLSRSSDNGQTWTSPEHLNTNAREESPYPGWDFAPSLAADSAGRWIGVWESEEDFDGLLNDPQSLGHFDTDILNARFTFSQIEIVEPEPSQLDGPDLTTDDLVLMVFGHERWGLAADGVTRLLVRVPVPGPGAVEFRITDDVGGTTGVGGLYAPGSTTETTTLAVPVSQPLPGRYIGFAVLRAPEDFVRSASEVPLSFRPVELTAEYFPLGGGPPLTYTREVRVVRPPVVLLHGLWSGSSTWGSGGQPWTLPADPRFVVRKYDYSRTSAAGFDVNVPKVRKAIDQAVGMLHDSGAAATQVDVVGHSMGGILARLYAANANHDYLRDTNYGSGEFNRLISLDTPHLGSPLANTLLNIAATPVVGRPIRELMEISGYCATCGAIEDLRCDGPSISALPAASLAVHAIAADGGSDAQLVLERVPLEYRIYNLLFFLGYDFPDVFLPEGFHDVVVGLISQRGGLSPAHTTQLDWSSLSEQGTHFSVTKEQRVSTEIVGLLNTGLNDPDTYASGFPANGGVPPTCPASVAVSRSAHVPTTGGIAITQPLAGALVNPGQSLTVTVDGFGGYVPQRIYIVCGDDGVIVDSPPFTATINLALDRTASVTLSALAVDASGVYAVADSVQLQTVQVASLRAVLVDNSPLSLTSSGPDEWLLVSGLYDDGVRRDISASAMGTSYASQNPLIATVDADGRVVAKGIGTVAIDIENDGYSDQAFVFVESLPLTLVVSRDGPSWPVWGGAAGYDVVRGALNVLRSTGGDFAAATAACLSNNESETSVEDGTIPTPGDGIWYLVRVVYSDAGNTGSYDDIGTGTNRDIQIAASANACP